MVERAAAFNIPLVVCRHDAAVTAATSTAPFIVSAASPTCFPVRLTAGGVKRNAWRSETTVTHCCERWLADMPRMGVACQVLDTLKLADGFVDTGKHGDAVPCVLRIYEALGGRGKVKIARYATWEEQESRKDASRRGVSQRGVSTHGLQPSGARLRRGLPLRVVRLYVAACCYCKVAQ